jgi:GT2 family glycosyltransferase
MPSTLSFVIPSRPGADLSGFKAQIAGLDLGGCDAEFFFVEGTLPPLQRNVAIARTRGEFVFLLDDDLVLPRDLVAGTLAHFDDDRVAAIGGPNLTPADDPPFAQLSGEILASPMATGVTSSRWREGTPDYDATEQKLHGCFLCFRGDLLRQYLFVEDLFPNDENELMWRLRRDGYRLCYLPAYRVYHKRRRTARTHLKQVYISGRGRGELVRRSGVGGQWVYLGPLALLLYLLMSLLAALSSLLARRAGRLLMVPAVAYAGLALVLSVSLAIRRRRLNFLWGGPLMFASHLAYATGLLKGLAIPTAYARDDVVVRVEVRSGRPDVSEVMATAD